MMFNIQCDHNVNNMSSQDSSDLFIIKDLYQTQVQDKQDITRYNSKNEIRWW